MLMTDLTKVTQKTSMREKAYRNLSAKLRGSIITAGSGEYEVARRVYNGMIDRRPDVIVRCADAADVMTAVSSVQRVRPALASRIPAMIGSLRSKGDLGPTNLSKTAIVAENILVPA